LGSEVFSTTEIVPTGKDILSLITAANGKPGYLNCDDGTSCSAPVVSGIVGMMLSENPKLTPAQVKKILVSNVAKFPIIQDRPIGAGIVNAYKAVTAARLLRIDATKYPGLPPTE